MVALALVGSALVSACAEAAVTPTPSLAPTPTAVTPTPSLAPSPTLLVTPAPSPAVSPVPETSPAASAPASPGSSVAPSPPDLGVDPDRTLPPGMDRWPDSVVNATIELAAVDNELREASADFAVGARTQDVELILAAAQGMAFLASESRPSAERLTTWEDTRDVGERLLAAYQQLEVQGDALAAAATSGDAPGFEAAATGLASAMAAYGAVREDLMDRAELALVMRRGLLVR